MITSLKYPIWRFKFYDNENLGVLASFVCLALIFGKESIVGKILFGYIEEVFSKKYKSCRYANNKRTNRNKNLCLRLVSTSEASAVLQI